MDARVAELAAEVEQMLGTPDGRLEGLARAERFLEWFNYGEIEPQDRAMLDRIRGLLDAGEQLIGPDLIFIVHECVEDQMVRDRQLPAHNALRRKYGEYANYAPQVIKEHRTQFNPAWFDYWGLPWTQ